MSTSTTEVTEIGTALGMLVSDRSDPLAELPRQLRYVSDDVWSRFVVGVSGPHSATFGAAFENGRYFFRAQDGLRSREPLIIDWKGPHRPPGDDVAPIDLRIDHVFLVSCKYLSRVLLNAGPARLFERLLIGDERSSSNWFRTVAEPEHEAFYQAVRSAVGPQIAESFDQVSSSDRELLKSALADRQLPVACRDVWVGLTEAVARRTATLWAANLGDRRSQLRLLWRLLRIGDSPYFVLGHDGRDTLRLRVSSKWDWLQDFEFRKLRIYPRKAGQPEVGWRAEVWRRHDGCMSVIDGHVEIRWSHGRLQGAPEAKVYLDSRHEDVPGYWPLT